MSILHHAASSRQQARRCQTPKMYTAFKIHQFHQQFDIWTRPCNSRPMISAGVHSPGAVRISCASQKHSSTLSAGMLSDPAQKKVGWKKQLVSTKFTQQSTQNKCGR